MENRDVEDLAVQLFAQPIRPPSFCGAFSVQLAVKHKKCSTHESGSEATHGQEVQHGVGVLCKPLGNHHLPSLL